MPGTPPRVLVAAGVLVTQAPTVGTGWALAAGALAACRSSRSGARPSRLACAWPSGSSPGCGASGRSPARGRWRAGFALQVAFALLQGASFAVLLRSLDHDVPFLAAALGANAMAFGLGLLAVPVPSGLLVREGLLVAILHPVAGAATVVTAAVVQRLAAIAVEIVMLGANRLSPTGSIRPRHRHRCT